MRKVINSGYKRTLKDTIATVNLKNRGWKNYFKDEYSKKCFKDMNWFVLQRFNSFINHRSQRRSRPLRDGESYTQDCGDMAMNHFNKGAVGFPCACLTTRMTGEPYSGNLYLRFDEDLGRKTPEITLLPL